MENNDTKKKILLTAIDLFNSQGFDKTTAALIAKKCEISQASIFYHFKNKMALFEATLDYIVLNNKEVFEHYEHPEKEAPIDRLIRFLEANIKWAYKFPQEAKIILMLFNFSTWDEKFLDLSTKTIDMSKKKVKDFLNEIDEIEQIKSPLDHEKLANIIQQYTNAVVFQLLAHKEKAKIKKEFKRDLRVFIENLLGQN
jgi:AcrR family transcriptional regulator